MLPGLIPDLHIEVALEDALAYYGLIVSSRLEHPDFGESDEDKNAPCASESSDQTLFKIVEIAGITSLFATTDCSHHSRRRAHT